MHKERSSYERKGSQIEEKEGRKKKNHKGSEE